MEPFRTRETTPEIDAPVEITPDTTNHGNQDKAITSEPELSLQSELEKWETTNGNYLNEYLGIKEISREFPYNAQSSQIDKYIKGELTEKGFDKTPSRYQELLTELEKEAGSDKLNAVDRLKRLTGYIQVLNNLKKAQQKKQLYASPFST